MKPGDHPEFFKRPPPPGRSRESSITLQKDGTFTHDGEPVSHHRLARAFASWVTRHPDDGRFILNNGYDWSYFTVIDAPFLVTRVHAPDGTAGPLVIELFDGTSEPLLLDELEIGSNDALYCKVKDGTFRARFSPAAQLQLAPWLVDGENGIEIQHGGLRGSPIQRIST